MVIGQVGPWVIGTAFQLPIASSLSPVATFIRLQESGLQESGLAMYPPTPLLAVHLFGIAFWSWGLLGITRRLARQVDRRLESMGIPTAAAATS
jgi:hypothetical protein